MHHTRQDKTNTTKIQSQYFCWFPSKYFLFHDETPQNSPSREEEGEPEERRRRGEGAILFFDLFHVISRRKKSLSFFSSFQAQRGWSPFFVSVKGVKGETSTKETKKHIKKQRNKEAKKETNKNKQTKKPKNQKTKNKKQKQNKTFLLVLLRISSRRSETERVSWVEDTPPLFLSFSFGGTKTCGKKKGMKKRQKQRGWYLGLVMFWLFVFLMFLE